MKKVSLIGVTETILICMMAIIAVNTTINVVFRFVFNNALGWSDELAGYLLVWVSLIGATLVLHEKSHIGFDWLINKFPGKVKTFLELTSHICVGFFLLVFSYHGSILVFTNWDDRAVTFNLSKGIIFLVLPLSGIAMLAVTVRNFISSLKKYREYPSRLPSGV